MRPMCILAEKHSAEQNMAKAYDARGGANGTTGTFHGKPYKLTRSHGHLFGYKEPEQMVPAKYEKDFKTWDPNYMPWRVQLIQWIKAILKGDKKDVQKIADDARGCSCIVIGTDPDPDGEGDLLGREITNGIGWKKPVYRMRQQGEGRKALRTALANMTPITTPKNQGMYRMAIARTRWDFVSMQLTRIATSYARQHGFPRGHTVNEGRLKSVYIYHIYQRLLAIMQYHKHPYYEVRFRDGNGHVFSRNKQIAERFKTPNEAQGDLRRYHQTRPANIRTVKKTKAPGPLLDLSSLGAELAPLGYSSKNVLDTYQKMYEDDIVSYPRTADTKITKEMFQDLLPYVDKIADVVGVDKSLLTHRTLRKKHMEKKADHGANRPGHHVPSSLAALKKYGSSGPAIYKTLAKNYLAILCPDYVYAKTTASLSDYPQFKTSFTRPLKLNYKAVYNDSSKKRKNSVKPLGLVDMPFVHQGANPKPSWPTKKWINRYLKKKNVGTGATRLDVDKELTSGYKRKLNSKRGKLNLTRDGLVCAVMARGTLISNADVTRRLHEIMELVRDGKWPIKNLVDTSTTVVEHDKPVFKANSEHLQTLLAPFHVKISNPNDRFTVVFNGRKVHPKRVYAGHRFTDTEVSDLVHGKRITLRGVGKGHKLNVVGDLAWQRFIDKKTGKVNRYLGFHVLEKWFGDRIFMNDGHSFNRMFAGHRFTNIEITALKHHKRIRLKNVGKNHKMNFIGDLAWLKHTNQKTGKSSNYLGFRVLKKWYGDRVFLRDGRSFNRVFMGHRFTDNEVRALETNQRITIKNIKYKKWKYTVTGYLAEQVNKKGHRFLGFYPMNFQLQSSREYVTAPNGKRYNRKYYGHRFTDAEVKTLNRYGTVSLVFYTSQKKGHLSYVIKGRLGDCAFKNNKGKIIQYYGFKRISSSWTQASLNKFKAWQRNRAKWGGHNKSHSKKNTWPVARTKGKLVYFNPKFSSHKFTADEIKELQDHQTIEITFTAKTGKSYQVEGKLEWHQWHKKKRYGFKITKWL